jgi:hypothetical protein
VHRVRMVVHDRRGFFPTATEIRPQNRAAVIRFASIALSVSQMNGPAWRDWVSPPVTPPIGLLVADCGAAHSFSRKANPRARRLGLARGWPREVVLRHIQNTENPDGLQNQSRNATA